jgi:hypothetical protein
MYVKSSLRFTKASKKSFIKIHIWKHIKKYPEELVIK